MGNLEERVIELEGQARSHTTALDGVRVEVGELRLELRTSIAQVRSEMATRTDIADVRREMTDFRREMGELRSEVNHRIDLLDAKFDRHFMWLTGIMMSGFITMIGAVVAVLFQVNSIR